jgi:large subunit ribosomal protein L1
MAKHGKRYRAAIADHDPDIAVPLADAVERVKKNATADFDETVEIHIRTGLDPRHSDQQVRGTTNLPHGLGKTIRVAVFAEGEAARDAEQAGAVVVGDDDLIARVENGFTDFDVALAQRELMGKVGKLGRVLGPRGLMPNPRSGTVVGGNEIGKAVEEAQAGRVEFRLDRLAIMHVPVGKASFEDAKLLDNISSLVQEIVKAKPSGAKGTYIRGMHLTSTMGPSVKMEVQGTIANTED